MRACTILTQHIWAGKYAVTQGTKLEADAVRREIVKAVDEGGKRVQRRCHVYRQDLILRLCVFYHKLQDTDTLQEKLISNSEVACENTHLVKEAGKLVCPLKFPFAMNVIDDTRWNDKQIVKPLIQYLLLKMLH
jgi:hypothetical protein